MKVLVKPVCHFPLALNAVLRSDNQAQLTCGYLIPVNDLSAKQPVGLYRHVRGWIASNQVVFVLRRVAHEQQKDGIARVQDRLVVLDEVEQGARCEAEWRLREAGIEAPVVETAYCERSQ
jgi:hypothetical protein